MLPGRIAPAFDVPDRVVAGEDYKSDPSTRGVRAVTGAELPIERERLLAIRERQFQAEQFFASTRECIRSGHFALLIVGLVFSIALAFPPRRSLRAVRLWLRETFLDSMPRTARRENRGPDATTSNADEQPHDPDTTSNADEQPPETGDRGSSRGAGARMSRESSYGNKIPKSTLSSVSEIRVSALVLRSPGSNGVASSRSHARNQTKSKIKLCW